MVSGVLFWWAVMAWARTLEKAEMRAVWRVAVTIGGAMVGLVVGVFCLNWRVVRVDWWVMKMG